MPEKCKTDADRYIYIDTGALGSLSTSGNETNACITLASTIAFKQFAPSKVLLVVGSHRGKEFLSLLEELQWYQESFNHCRESIEVTIAINDMLNPDKATQADENIEFFTDGFLDALDIQLQILGDEAWLVFSKHYPDKLDLFQQEWKKFIQSPSKMELTPLAKADDAIVIVLKKAQFLIQLVENIDKYLVNANFSENGHRRDAVLAKLADNNSIKLSRGMLTPSSRSMHLNLLKQVLLATSNFFDELFNQELGLKKQALLQTVVDYGSFYDTITLLAQFYRDNIELDEKDRHILSTFVAQYNKSKMLAATNESTQESSSPYRTVASMRMFGQISKDEDNYVLTVNINKP